ncbi:LytS/YhcK type 5TM receptor domain-containing protein [Sutcliffiella deserti]|uniref:LytS/YhcK type 5TM receptor domain-containing protein n=1 Tax=Sutcliffiella deserti TaxID=2875501 RepID=UPI001CBBBCF6|nr:LytS/YhcK type 5TM receptor domain-containing protein [Sutcliffiella deserti]
MNLLKDLLLQLFFLILPIFIYYHLDYRFHHRMSPFKKQLSAFLHCSASIILCLHFPIKMSEGYFFDLSTIPIIIAILYGGYLSGLLSISVLFLYPIFFDGANGYLFTYIAVPLLVLLPAALQPKWKSLPINKKYIVASVIMVIKLLLLYLSLFFQNMWQGFSTIYNSFLFFTFSGIILIIVMMLIIYLIEYYFDLNRLQMQMRRIRRFEHVSNLANDVSEEVNKPLTMVKGFTQLLGAEQNQANKEYVPIILSELHKAETIIDTYMNITHSEISHARYLSSKILIEQVMEGLQTYAKNHGVELQDKQSKNLRLHGNIDLLTDAFTSVVKYCIDAFSSSNGILSIRTFIKGHDVHFEISDKDGKMNSETLVQLKRNKLYTETSSNDQIQTALSVILAHNGVFTVKEKFLKKNKIIISLPAYVKKRSVSD